MQADASPKTMPALRTACVSRIPTRHCSTEKRNYVRNTEKSTAQRQAHGKWMTNGQVVCHRAFFRWRTGRSFVIERFPNGATAVERKSARTNVSRETFHMRPPAMTAATVTNGQIACRLSSAVCHPPAAVTRADALERAQRGGDRGKRACRSAWWTDSHGRAFPARCADRHRP